MDPETQRAIAACVRSIEELEVLLFLARDRRRYCSADTISADTGLAVRSAAAALELLGAPNLLRDPIAPAARTRCLATQSASC